MATAYKKLEVILDINSTSARKELQSVGAEIDKTTGKLKKNIEFGQFGQATQDSQEFLRILENLAKEHKVDIDFDTSKIEEVDNLIQNLNEHMHILDAFQKTWNKSEAKKTKNANEAYNISFLKNALNNLNDVYNDTDVDEYREKVLGALNVVDNALEKLGAKYKKESLLDLESILGLDNIGDIKSSGALSKILEKNGIENFKKAFLPSIPGKRGVDWSASKDYETAFRSQVEDMTMYSGDFENSEYINGIDVYLNSRLVAFQKKSKENIDKLSQEIQAYKVKESSLLKEISNIESSLPTYNDYVGEMRDSGDINAYNVALDNYNKQIEQLGYLKENLRQTQNSISESKNQLDLNVGNYLKVTKQLENNGYDFTLGDNKQSVVKSIDEIMQLISQLKTESIEVPLSFTIKEDEAYILEKVENIFKNKPIGLSFDVGEDSVNVKNKQTSQENTTNNSQIYAVIPQLINAINNLNSSLSNFGGLNLKIGVSDPIGQKRIEGNIKRDIIGTQESIIEEIGRTIFDSGKIKNTDRNSALSNIAALNFGKDTSAKLWNMTLTGWEKNQKDKNLTHKIDFFDDFIKEALDLGEKKGINFDVIKPLLDNLSQAKQRLKENADGAGQNNVIDQLKSIFGTDKQKIEIPEVENLNVSAVNTSENIKKEGDSAQEASKNFESLTEAKKQALQANEALAKSALNTAENLNSEGESAKKTADGFGTYEERKEKGDKLYSDLTNGKLNKNIIYDSIDVKPNGRVSFKEKIKNDDGTYAIQNVSGKYDSFYTKTGNISKAGYDKNVKNTRLKEDREINRLNESIDSFVEKNKNINETVDSFDDFLKKQQEINTYIDEGNKLLSERDKLISKGIIDNKDSITSNGQLDSIENNIKNFNGGKKIDKKTLDELISANTILSSTSSYDSVNKLKSELENKFNDIFKNGFSDDNFKDIVGLKKQIEANINAEESLKKYNETAEEYNKEKYRALKAGDSYSDNDKLKLLELNMDSAKREANKYLNDSNVIDSIKKNIINSNDKNESNEDIESYKIEGSISELGYKFEELKSIMESVPNDVDGLVEYFKKLKEVISEIDNLNTSINNDINNNNFLSSNKKSNLVNDVSNVFGLNSDVISSANYISANGSDVIQDKKKQNRLNEFGNKIDSFVLNNGFNENSKTLDEFITNQKAANDYVKEGTKLLNEWNKLIQDGTVSDLPNNSIINKVIDEIQNNISKINGSNKFNKLNDNTIDLLRSASNVVDVKSGSNKNKYIEGLQKDLSDYIVERKEEIDNAIQNGINNGFTKDTIDKIIANKKNIEGILPFVKGGTNNKGEEIIGAINLGKDWKLKGKDDAEQYVFSFLKNAGKDVKSVEKVGDFSFKALTSQGQELSYTLKPITNEFGELIASVTQFSASGAKATKVFSELASNLANIGIKFLDKYISWQAFEQGLQVVKQLDGALTNINMTMDATSDQLDKVANSSFDFAKESGSTVNNVLEAAKIYANANETADSIIKKANTTVLLSNATGQDTRVSAQQIQSVTAQFDLVGEERRIVNSYEKISSNLAIDFAQGINGMAEAVKNSGAVAHEAGLDLEEYMAAVGKIQEVTRQEGGQIGNMLKTTMARISRSKTSDEGVSDEQRSNASKAYASVGISLYNKNGEYRDLSDTLTELADKWDTLTDAQRNYIAEQSAGTRGINIFNALMKNWGEVQNLAEDALSDNSFIDKTQEKYSESLTAKMNELKTAWQEIQYSLLNSDGIKTLIDGATLLLNIFEKILNVVSSIGDLLTFGNGGILSLGALFAGKDILKSGLKNVASDLIKGIKTEGFEKSNIWSVILSSFTKGIKKNGIIEMLGGVFDKIGANIIKIFPSISKLLPVLGGLEVTILGLTSAAAGLAVFATAALAFDKATTSSKELQESISNANIELKDLRKNSNSAKTTINDVGSKWSELKQKENSGFDLTSDEQNELIDYNNQIASALPNTVKYFDAQGNAILNLKGSLAELNTEYDEYVSKLNSDFFDENINSYLKQLNNDKGNMTFGDSLATWASNLFHPSEWNQTSRDLYGSEYLTEYYKNIQDIYEQEGSLAAAEEIYKYRANSSLSKVTQDDLRYNARASVEEIQKILDSGKLSSVIQKYEDEIYNDYTDLRNAISSLVTAKGLDNELDENIVSYISEMIQNSSDEFIDSLDNDESKIRDKISDYIDTFKDDNLSGRLDQIFSINDNLNLEQIRNILDNSSELFENLNITPDELYKQTGISDYIEALSEYDSMMKKLSSNEWGSKLYDIGKYFNDNTINNKDNIILFERLLNDYNDLSDVLKEFEFETIDISVNNEEIGVLKSNLKSIKDDITNVGTALKESFSSSGMSLDSIDNLKNIYKDIDDYDESALFENTAAGVKINVKELDKLKKQYKKTQTDKYTKQLEKLKKQYALTSEKIGQNADATKASNNALISQRDQIGQQISSLEELISMYEGATDAVTEWQDATSNGERGDLYDTISSNGIEGVKKRYERGEVGTEEFKSFVNMITNEDISDWSIDKIVQAYESKIGQIESWFNNDTPGAGLQDMLTTLNQANSKLAYIDDNGDWQIQGKAEEFAKALGVDVSLVDVLMNKLRDMGFDIDYEEEQSDYLKNLRTDAEEAEKALSKLDGKKVKVDLEGSSKDIGTAKTELSKVNDEIDNIDKKIQEVNTRHEHGGFASAEEYQAALKPLQEQKDYWVQIQSYIEACIGSLSQMSVDINSPEGLAKLNSDLEKLEELTGKKYGITWNTNSTEVAKQNIQDVISGLKEAKKLTKDGEFSPKMSQEEIESTQNVLEGLTLSLAQAELQSNKVMQIDFSGQALDVASAGTQLQNVILLAQEYITSGEQYASTGTQAFADIQNAAGTALNQALSDSAELQKELSNLGIEIDYDKIDLGKVSELLTGDIDIDTLKSTLGFEENNPSEKVIESIQEAASRIVDAIRGKDNESGDIVKDNVLADATKLAVDSLNEEKENNEPQKGPDESMVVDRDWRKDFSGLWDKIRDKFLLPKDEYDKKYESKTDNNVEMSGNKSNIEKLLKPEIDTDLLKLFGSKTIEVPVEPKLTNDDSRALFEEIKNSMNADGTIDLELAANIIKKSNFSDDVKREVLEALAGTTVDSQVNVNETTGNITGTENVTESVKESVSSTPVETDVQVNVNASPSVLGDAFSSISEAINNAVGRQNVSANSGVTVPINGDDSDVKNKLSQVDQQASKPRYLSFIASGLSSIVSQFNSLVNKTITINVIKNETTRKGNADGNAHAFGNAFARGTWGAAQSGMSLVGELGREIIVRGNQWFTVGDNGAEMFPVQRGDIIFNHKIEFCGLI